MSTSFVHHPAMIRLAALTRLAAVATLVCISVGCPNSSDKDNAPATAPSASAEQRTAQPPTDAQRVAEAMPAILPEPTIEPQPAVAPGPQPAEPSVAADEPSVLPEEPSVLPEEPTAQPISDAAPAGVQPAAASDRPLRRPAELPVGVVNPLRREPAPASEEPPVVRNPPVASDHSTASTRPRPGKDDAKAFDPVKENGPIFVGWPKPKLALVITGQQEGFIEPCGCAGLDRMKGGMSRRHSLFNDLRQRGWPVVGLDVGGLAKGYGRQAELKFHTLVEGMRKMPYSAIALGTSELQLQTGELAAEAASDEQHQSPFLSANVALFGFDAMMTTKSRIVEAGGIRLGVTSVLGKTFQRQINNAEIEMSDPQTALAALVPKLNAEADYLVLLAHATMEESRELGRKFPQFDLVVTAGGAPEPPDKPARIDGSNTLLIEVGEKGMHAIVLGLYSGANPPLRYQRVPVDSRFPASPQMQILMKVYQDQLKELGFAGLGIPLGSHAPQHPQKETCGEFVGSEKCESCHEPSYEVWKKSGHAKAYRTLVKLDPPRHFDPECVSCHVVGWHPTGHYPYQGGYESREKTPELLNTGCESCHGPGGAHVAAEMGTDEALQAKLRKAAVITKEESKQRQCYTCHDLDNSPAFDFDTYWPLIEHQESD